jgi:hypothetical protein
MVISFSEWLMNKLLAYRSLLVFYVLIDSRSYNFGDLAASCLLRQACRGLKDLQGFLF